MNKKIDVDGWFTEKVLNSFVELAKGAILSNELQKEISRLNLPSDQAEQFTYLTEGIHSNLHAAIYDLVKVVSCLEDPIEGNTYKDANEILEKGEEGLANVLIKHGLSEDLPWLGLAGKSTVDRLRKEEEISKMLKSVKALVETSSRAARTEVFDLLQGIRNNEKSKIILNLMEPVSLGEKDWQTFQNEVQDVLAS
jgi:hypothetical protein